MKPKRRKSQIIARKIQDTKPKKSKGSQYHDKSKRELIKTIKLQEARIASLEKRVTDLKATRKEIREDRNLLQRKMKKAVKIVDKVRVNIQTSSDSIENYENKYKRLAKKFGLFQRSSSIIEEQSARPSSDRLPSLF